MKNFVLFVFAVILAAGCQRKGDIYICGDKSNEIYEVLVEEGFNVRNYASPQEAVNKAEKGSAVMLLSKEYPLKPIKITDEILSVIKEKNLRVYAEFVNEIPGYTISSDPYHSKLERGIVVDSCFMPDLQPMDLLGINDCSIYKAEVNQSLIVLGKVAGFNTAAYGIDDIETYPMLVEDHNCLWAFTKLSNFRTGRYAPEKSWKNMWSYIISFLMDRPFEFAVDWPTHVQPMYGRDEPLKSDAKTEMIRKGVEWFYKGRFFVDPSWKKFQLEREGDGLMPVGLALDSTFKVGDGSLGILEGHASNIYYDGNQDYRFWLRNDVQGEACMALASVGDLLKEEKYITTAKNLLDYVFETSPFRKGERNNPQSPVYGLLGWSETHDYVFYDDDNARSILGMIAGSAFIHSGKWNKEIIECIMANFRLANKNGFFAPGGRLEQPQIIENGWQYYADRPDFINPHPHFESWMWACYLWLYNKTGYAPLYEKAEKAIRITMEAYPDRWGWTNGIQQERARMILPLAWLVRVENTEEHRRWLDIMVQEVLSNQVECGAIQEELGANNGTFGGPKKNSEYGVTEAPLIFKNGDPVADMLYTTNFAFFALNEAAKATNNEQYIQAVNKMSDFLTRIQVHSDEIDHLDGAWFRAFDYEDWEYWASNADPGWGAWSTLTGWIQSWIVSTQCFVLKNKSYWEATRDFAIPQDFTSIVKEMGLNQDK